MSIQLSSQGGEVMVATNVVCAKLDTCPKITMVLDKDLAGDWQYADAIRAVCAACDQKDAK